MLIGTASELENYYIATYNPNYYNQLTTTRDGETEEARKSRTNGRWGCARSARRSSTPSAPKAA